MKEPWIDNGCFRQSRNILIPFFRFAKIEKSASGTNTKPHQKQIYTVGTPKDYRAKICRNISFTTSDFASAYSCTYFQSLVAKCFFVFAYRRRSSSCAISQSRKSIILSASLHPIEKTCKFTSGDLPLNIRCSNHSGSRILRTYPASCNSLT